MTLQEHLGKVSRLVDFVREGVWAENPDAVVGWRRWGIQATRFVSTTVKGFLRHKCGLYAAGLTYFSMLAFVPMLCLLMIFAKVCGADALAREKINEHLDAAITQIEQGQAQAPAKDSTPAQVEEARLKAEASKELARQAREFSNDVFDRIKKMDVRALGWVGFIMLMWTAISTFSQVETSMNEVWEVEKTRPLWQRCALYLFISMVLPLLLAFAMSLPILHVVKDVVDATLGATGYTRWLGEKLVAVLASRWFGYAVALVFATVAAAFVLKIIPHRKVQMRAAIEGGLVTAILFGGWMKACTSIGVGIAKSSALYGSFATVPILLAWIYMSWQIVLLGSCITYAFQCVHSRVRSLPRQ
ncbi:MAG: YihY/virulence factor BrkB family protein [bacterium]|nr:YihY/virulence factor BrkB family protein [bacterium]